MRICIDFRPALHESTGVGTYVRGLLYGLLETFPDDRYSAFSASWHHRLEGAGAPVGARGVDVRFPVRLLDLLWNRVGWPPVAHGTGGIDIAHSRSPLPMPCRRARRVAGLPHQTLGRH